MGHTCFHLGSISAAHSSLVYGSPQEGSGKERELLFRTAAGNRAKLPFCLRQLFHKIFPRHVH